MAPLTAAVTIFKKMLYDLKVRPQHTDWFSIKTSNNPKMTILEFKVLAWKFIPNEAKI